MISYETLMLASPEITADESAALEKSINQLLERYQATLASFERWGKYRLAYPVRNHEYGVYFLIRFEIPNEQIVSTVLTELKSMLMVKFNDFIMRHITCRLDPRRPLSYHRPESLEEAPSHDVENFLRDSKMTGLLSSRSSRGYNHSHGRSDGRPGRSSDTEMTTDIIEEDTQDMQEV